MSAFSLFTGIIKKFKNMKIMFIFMTNVKLMLGAEAKRGAESWNYNEAGIKLGTGKKL